MVSSVAIGILVAGIAWFIAAAVLFFNPVVDKIYRSEEGHAAVRNLPTAPSTIGKILLAVFVQTILWAVVFYLVQPVLPDGKLAAGLAFGGLLTVTKIIPRDADRLLLTTYPIKRMTIEFIVGIICAAIVGIAFAYTIG